MRISLRAKNTSLPVSSSFCIVSTTFGELIHWHPHIHALVTDGAFAPDGTFHPLPAVAVEPFRELFAHKVLSLLLERGKIGTDVVENIRSWKHSGFSVDKSVRIEAGDRAGLERLLRYIVRCPFSIERVIRLSDNDHVIYHAEHDDPRRFPLPQGGASVPLARAEAARKLEACATSASQSAVAAAAEAALRGREIFVVAPSSWRGIMRPKPP